MHPQRGLRFTLTCSVSSEGADSEEERVDGILYMHEYAVLDVVELTLTLTRTPTLTLTLGAGYRGA